MKNIIITTLLSTLFANIVYANTTNKITDNNITHNKQTENIANFLNITPEELLKAQQIKAEYGNFIDGNVTPLEYLGYFAEAQAERKKYAELYATINRKVTQQILDFQEAVLQADKEKFGADNIINYTINAKAQKRNKYTIDIKNCNNSCIQEAKKLTNRSFITPVDLYFINATDEKIRQFAQSINLTLESVNSGFITLNYAQ
jgi:integrating conjugative element protein (TIGR03759 family)